MLFKPGDELGQKAGNLWFLGLGDDGCLEH
jgi:hypothetical protein